MAWCSDIKRGREGAGGRGQEEEVKKWKTEGRKGGRKRERKGGRKGRITTSCDPNACTAWAKNHMSTLQPFHYFQLLSFVCFSVVPINWDPFQICRFLGLIPGGIKQTFGRLGWDLGLYMFNKTLHVILLQLEVKTHPMVIRTGLIVPCTQPSLYYPLCLFYSFLLSPKISFPFLHPIISTL